MGVIMDLHFIGQLFKGIFTFSGNLLQSIFAYAGIATFLIGWLFPKLGGKVKGRLEWLSQHKVNILLGFLLLSTILTSYNLYENKLPNFAPPEELISNSLNGLTIRIADLAAQSTTIRNKVITDCYLYGPAVVFPDNSAITYCEFTDHNISNVVIVTTNELVAGVITFESCIITRCHFINVALICTPDELEELEKGFIVDK
jgi:hypothetical protein